MDLGERPMRCVRSPCSRLRGSRSSRPDRERGRDRRPTPASSGVRSMRERGRGRGCRSARGPEVRRPVRCVSTLDDHTSRVCSIGVLLLGAGGRAALYVPTAVVVASRSGVARRCRSRPGAGTVSTARASSPRTSRSSRSPRACREPLRGRSARLVHRNAAAWRRRSAARPAPTWSARSSGRKRSRSVIRRGRTIEADPALPYTASLEIHATNVQLLLTLRERRGCRWYAMPFAARASVRRTRPPSTVW